MVNDILTSMLGGEFMLRVHHDVGVVAFVGKEWGLLGQHYNQPKLHPKVY